MTDINIEEGQKLLQQCEEKSFSGAFKHISYSEKIDKSIDELLKTSPKSIIKWGWEVWDEKLGGIYGGKIYVVGGESGIGKSTFVNNVCLSLSKQGVKVTKYSLEDRMEDIGKEDLFTYCNRVRFKRGLDLWSFVHFVNNEYFSEEGKFYNENNILYLQEAKKILTEHSKQITELDKKRMVTIEDMVKLMEEEAKAGTKVFFIDHLHYFKKTGKERTDLEFESIMHDINEIARIYNVAVFILAHYRKLNDASPSNDSFKDASGIKQVANIIIHIMRDGGMTKFVLGKVRGKLKCKGFLGNYDIATDSYTGFTELTED